MSTPHFLTSSHRYFRRQGVSDVQTIIDDFYAETVTNGGWTDRGSGKLRSPVDSAARWMDITLARAAVNKLSMRVDDQFGTTICLVRAQGVLTNAWDVRIFTGQFHAYIDIVSNPASSYSAGNAECVHAGILDLSPEVQTAHQTYVYGNGSRNTLDQYSNYNNWNYAYMCDHFANVQNQNRCGLIGLSGSGAGIRTLGGARTYYPREFWAGGRGQWIDGANYAHYAGRAYQTLLVDNTLGNGSEIYVSIDAGVPAKFVIVSGIAYSQNRMVAVRAD
jgi:hypothetical protein